MRRSAVRCLASVAGSLTLLVVPGVAAALATVAAKSAATVDGIVVEVGGDDSDAAATVTGYEDGRSGDVKIPGTVTIDGTDHKVTTIGADAFRESNLDRVQIPDSVGSIKSEAFSESSVTEINIPDSVRSIEDYAFSGSGLITVDVPESVELMGDDVFIDSALEEASFAASVKAIPDGTFAGCSLSELEISSPVTTIEPLAFSSNELTDVNIPDSVTYIGGGAFEDNELTRVQLPPHAYPWRFHHDQSCGVQGQRVDSRVDPQLGSIYRPAGVC